MSVKYQKKHCIHLPSPHVTVLLLPLSNHKQVYQKFRLCEQAIWAAHWASMQVIDLSKLNFHKGLKPVFICVYMLWEFKDLMEAITLAEAEQLVWTDS